MVTADEAVANSAVYFAGRTTTFKCKYPRAVSVDGSFTIPDQVVGVVRVIIYNPCIKYVWGITFTRGHLKLPHLIHNLALSLFRRSQWLK